MYPTMRPDATWTEIADAYDATHDPELDWEPVPAPDYAEPPRAVLDRWAAEDAADLASGDLDRWLDEYAGRHAMQGDR